MNEGKEGSAACSDFPLAEFEVTLFVQTTEIKSAHRPALEKNVSYASHLLHSILLLVPDVYAQGIKMSASQLPPLELSAWCGEECTIFDTI